MAPPVTHTVNCGMNKGFSFLLIITSVYMHLSCLPTEYWVISMAVLKENLRGIPAAFGGSAAGGDRDVWPAGSCSKVHYLGYDPSPQRPTAFQQGIGALIIIYNITFLASVWAWKLTFISLQLSLQMQQLLEPSLHPESWSPVKIKFDWDASYWMKEISTLGKINIDVAKCTGGHCRDFIAFISHIVNIDFFLLLFL